MSPAARKFVITFVLIVASLSVMALVILGAPNRPRPQEADAKQPADQSVEPASQTESRPESQPAVQPDPPSAPTETPAGAAQATPEVPAQQQPQAAEPSPAPALEAPKVALSARPPNGGFTDGRLPASIGSLDPKIHPYRIEFAPSSAGIESIIFADFWATAADRHAARRHALDPTRPLPPDGARYVLATSKPLYQGSRVFDIPVFAAHSVTINDVAVILFGNVWSELAPGHFATEIVDATGTALYRIERRFEIVKGTYEMNLRQQFVNNTAAPVRVSWVQYGPMDLAADPGANVDVRRFHFGYLTSPARDPGQEFVIASGQMFEHATVLKQANAGNKTLWPNSEAVSGGFSMSWYGTTSRYFGLAVHPPFPGPGTGLPPGQRAIGSAVERVHVLNNLAPDPRYAQVLSELHSGVRTVPPSGTTNFDLGVFAGPLDPSILKAQPYASLSMYELIVYALSSCCTACTFPWLARLLLAFLGFLHDYVVFDWGLAIIVLVIVVRFLLHPLMKSSQIKMQRFGKAMSELKPELDALQARYKNEPQKLQQEQLRLYREKKVNPAGCIGGILPTLLQTPIWIALYAALYISFDLRQAPAFFGVFQNFGGWQFLGDLSLPDNFFAFSEPINLGLFYWRGINILPLLMGIVFFIQQKYMTPQMANLTPEQEQQQKIMKVMMVVMFPLMLYAAPSGLTLYILTSTCIGIIESRRVKAHIEKYGLDKPVKVGKDGKPKQDRLGKLYEQMLERARAQQEQKSRKTFKDRE